MDVGVKSTEGRVIALHLPDFLFLGGMGHLMMLQAHPILLPFIF